MSPARALLLTSLLAVGGSAAATVPDFDAVRAAHAASEAVLLDRHGEPVHEQRVDLARRRTAWVPLDAMSPHLVRTVLAIEDRRFHRHRGVDWRAVAAAAGDALRGRGVRGASTITMQVAALLDPGLRQGRGLAALPRKWDQMRAAWALEAAWSKDRILEAYLNLASFRGEVEGIGAASRMLLGKRPAGLDSVDALLLASLLAAPNRDASAAVARACGLGRALELDVDCRRLAARARNALDGTPRLEPDVALAPHVAQGLLDVDNPLVHSTLDREVQHETLALLRRQLGALAAQNVRDGAALVVDNASGEVLAYVGNAWPRASRRYVDGVRALRQAGSTLKPFLYEQALERRLLTAASLLDDSPLELTTPAGLYVPQNYDRDFKGLVSLRQSLAGSLNIPAVRTLLLLGPDAFARRLRALGLDGVTETGEYYGYALALGSAEVSLWQLVNAYRTLANGGVASPLVLEPGASTAGARPVLGRASSFVVSHILGDRASRERAFGHAGPLATPFWSAVKTGTSKHMRDNWCIGYSDRYTVGVWVGNFDGSPMWDVSGLSGAAPVWAGIMHWLHHARPGEAPAAPAGVVRRTVRFAAGGEAPREEWFLAGTERARVDAQPALAPAPRIVYPGRDSILVLDPDIPPERERVFFRMTPPAAGLDWVLNGEALGAGTPQAWAPRAGRHRLTLVDSHGRPVDEIRFQVRGSR